MDEPRARSASRLADLPAGVELGEYYSRQVEARPFILHPGSRWLAARWDAIVKRYARGWLLVDLACSLPLQLLLPWPSGWLPSLWLPRLVLAVHLPSRFRAAFKGTV